MINIEQAKKLKVGDTVLLECGLMSTITNTFPLSGEAMMFQIQNKYDGELEVTNNDIVASELD